MDSSTNSGGYFFGEAVLRRIGNLYLFALEDDFAYYTQDGLEVAIQRGYLTDLASTPRLTWAVFPPDDPNYADASVVHDFLYSSHLLPRDRADSILREAAAASGCHAVRRGIVWAAVRIGGARKYATGPARQHERIKKARDAGWL